MARNGPTLPGGGHGLMAGARTVKMPAESHQKRDTGENGRMGIYTLCLLYFTVFMNHPYLFFCFLINAGMTNTLGRV